MEAETAQWIIGAMGTAILGMAGYIVALHMKIARLYEERIKSLEDKLQLLTLLRQGQPPTTSAPQGGTD